MVLKQVGDQIRITWGALLHPCLFLERCVCLCVGKALQETRLGCKASFPFPNLHSGSRRGERCWEWVLRQPASSAKEPLRSLQQYRSLKRLCGLGVYTMIYIVIHYCVVHFTCVQFFIFINMLISKASYTPTIIALV